MVRSSLHPICRAMGQFDSLPGVFELARMYQGNANVVLTYDEYIKYLAIWRDLPESAQQLCMTQAKSRQMTVS